MRICPKCKYVDPQQWKHTKWSFWIDSCKYEDFLILSPELAKKLETPLDFTEDEDYVYRRTKSGYWVQRKAKVDFCGKDGWAEGVEKHSVIKSPYMADTRYWNRYLALQRKQMLPTSQTKLLPVNINRKEVAQKQ